MGMVLFHNEEAPVVGWLARVDGPKRGQTIRFGTTTTSIGSNPTADVVLDDLGNVDVHCRIVATPAGFVLYDGGGEQGVVANGRRAEKIELVDGDRVELGPAQYVFKGVP